MFEKKIVISDYLNLFPNAPTTLILLRPAYNNNTLPDTGINGNKIYKYKEHSYGKVKGVIFLKLAISNVNNLCHQEPWN
jgi:hypothetical protein